MSTVVRAYGLTKFYGRSRGVLDLDFGVEGGEVFGFLGPNGAGKTTTIRLMLDLFRPTRGGLELFGLDARGGSLSIRRRLGYVPGDLRLYDRLTGRELIRYFAALRRLSDTRAADDLAARLDLDRPIRALSRGNWQKVGLVQASMHRPDLLVLDEPTSGLDPLMQQVLTSSFASTADGRAVFLSSHVLSEVQHVADRVAVIREGRLELVSSVDDLRARAFTRVEVTFASPPPPDAFARISAVLPIPPSGNY